MNNRLKIYQKKKYQRKIKKAVTILGIAFFVFSSAQLLLGAFNLTDLTISAEDIEWNVLLNITEPGGAYDTVLFGEAVDADDERDNHDIPKPPKPPNQRKRSLKVNNSLNNSRLKTTRLPSFQRVKKRR